MVVPVGAHPIHHLGRCVGVCGHQPVQTRGLAVGDRVRIEAIMKIETTPGGAVKTAHTAQAVHRLHDDQN